MREPYWQTSHHLQANHMSFLCHVNSCGQCANFFSCARFSNGNVGTFKPSEPFADNIIYNHATRAIVLSHLPPAYWCELLFIHMSVCLGQTGAQTSNAVVAFYMLRPFIKTSKTHSALLFTQSMFDIVFVCLGLHVLATWAPHPPILVFHVLVQPTPQSPMFVVVFVCLALRCVGSSSSTSSSFGNFTICNVSHFVCLCGFRCVGIISSTSSRF